jgi:hypothetical protein
MCVFMMLCSSHLVCFYITCIYTTTLCYFYFCFYFSTHHRLESDFWHWNQTALSGVYELNLLRWETPMQLELGKSIEQMLKDLTEAVTTVWGVAFSGVAHYCCLCYDVLCCAVLYRAVLCCVVCLSVCLMAVGLRICCFSLLFSRCLFYVFAIHRKFYKQQCWQLS